MEANDTSVPATNNGKEEGKEEGEEEEVEGENIPESIDSDILLSNHR